MKTIIFLIILISSSNCFAQNPFDLSFKAFILTQKGKEIKKQANDELEKITQEIPDEMIGLLGIAIKQKAQFKFDKNHEIEFNLKKESIEYQFVYNF